MAREQRHDVDYFPHQCIHGRKMHIIENKFGNDGYAVWFKLLEQLGSANYHYLDISDPMNFLYLVSTFRVDESIARDILNHLAQLGAINKFLYENHQIIFSEKLVESVQDAYKKRKSKPLSIEDILRREKIQSGAETIQSDTETPQKGDNPTRKPLNPPESIPKEKKRKEKERKGEGNARASEVLKNEKKQEMDVLEMQNKRSVKNWQDLIDSFNDKMDIEVSQGKIEWEVDQLLPRFRTFLRSWIRNEKSDTKIPKQDSYESGKLPRL